MGLASSARAALRVFRHLGWRRYARAQADLLRAELALRRRPPGDLARAAPALPDREGEPLPAPADAQTDPDLALARRWARDLWGAARVGPVRSACLARAVALRRRLVASGHPEALVRVGVRKQDGELVAHAWVEMGGRPVDPSPGGAEEGAFTSLEGVRILDPE
ncbi:MAG TPA: lasso peptide biosynthesis B2 protein [Gemmatimonadota bacterium]|nr:lasso peptide biosynthesis B2 protein [Gemmatimonadota bacterium]